MDEGIYVLDMPDFQPVYAENIPYGYKGKRGRVLKKLLLETSYYHCMYCFASLKGDRTDLGELEHSVEKTLSDSLIECVPNISVTCNNCNGSLKRAGEKQRKGKMKPYIKQFEKNSNCKGIGCKGFCDAYAALRKHYCIINKLNLQPYGLKGSMSGLEYRIQYDIMNAEFIPSSRYSYDADDRDILEHHIRQFRLNDTDFRTGALIEFIEDTINADGKYSKRKNIYTNYIVDLFIEKIKHFSSETVLKICEKIYIHYTMRHIV